MVRRVPAVKRDMGLIRDLLLKIEGATGKPSWKDLVPGDDNAEVERVLKHLKLIEEAGLIKSVVVHLHHHRVPQSIELTWDGHEFLDDTRDPDIWQKTKDRAQKVAGVGLGLAWEIAKAEVKAKLGLP